MYLFRAREMRPGEYYRCFRGISAGGAILCADGDLLSMDARGEVKNHTTGITFRLSDVAPGIASRFRAHATDSRPEGGDAAE